MSDVRGAGMISRTIILCAPRTLCILYDDLLEPLFVILAHVYLPRKGGAVRRNILSRFSGCDSTKVARMNSSMEPLLVGMLLVLELMSVVVVEGAPARTDFWDCQLVQDIPGLFPRPGDKPLNCCKLEELMRKPEPLYKTWKQYLAENPEPRVPRVRPAAHLVAHNQTYLQQLDRAHQLFKALPETDPRSWTQMSNFHCMYGAYGAAHQAGRPDLVYSIHSNWLFLPFHRWFTFFYERILAKLVGDDNFALPFWNWDNQEAPLSSPHRPNIIPLFYREPDKYPSLFHPKRDAKHRPSKEPLTVDLIWANVYNEKPDQGHLATAAANRVELKRRLVDSTADGDLKWFLSHPWREGDTLLSPPDSLSTFEGSVHTAVHLWVGSAKHFFLDMGDSSSATKDPLFFAHHANVDRMWNVWLGLDGHKNFDDPDFLNAAFYFYDENAEIVRVTVAESLDSDLLKYTYQEVDNPWIYYDSSILHARS